MSITVTSPIDDSVVVFDTNAYRLLASGTERNPEAVRRRFHAIRREENARGIQALAYPFVIAELLAHCAEEADPAYAQATAAIIGLRVHCAGATGTRILAEPETHYAAEYYGVIDQRAKHLFHALSEICRYIDEGAIAPEIIRDIKIISDLVEKIEAQFISDVTAKVLDGQATVPTRATIYPGDPEKRKIVRDFLRSDKVLDLLAQSEAMRFFLSASSAARAGAEDPRGILGFTDEQISLSVQEVASDVLARFPLPLEIYRSFAEKLASNELNLTQSKWANLVWDRQIAFFASPHATVVGKRLILVTNDRAIHDAASKVGFGAFVLNTASYLRELGGSTLKAELGSS